MPIPILTNKVLQLLQGGRPDDWARDERFGKGPSERNLCHAHTVFLRDLGDSVEEILG